MEREERINESHPDEESKSSVGSSGRKIKPFIFGPGIEVDPNEKAREYSPFPPLPPSTHEELLERLKKKFDTFEKEESEARALNSCDRGEVTSRSETDDSDN